MHNQYGSMVLSSIVVMRSQLGLTGHICRSAEVVLLHEELMWPADSSVAASGGQSRTQYQAMPVIESNAISMYMSPRASCCIHSHAR
jgi:hypothetical protein